MNFAIQILNFNNYQVTIKAIQAIMDNDFNDHDIFVLDNGSSNDSYAYLKKIFLRKDLLRKFIFSIQKIIWAFLAVTILFINGLTQNHLKIINFIWS